MSTSVAPLPVPPLDPLVDRVRRAVVDAPDLSAAFLYLRNVGDGPVPAVGLVGDATALQPGSRAVAAVRDACGIVYGTEPTVVALAPDLDVLAAVLAVAPPLGAGGVLEVEMAAVAVSLHRRPDGGDTAPVATPAIDLPAAARAVGALIDAPLVVPTDGTIGSARGRFGAAARLELPTGRVGDDTAVGVFTSLYAMGHSVGSRPASTIAGWALVEALPSAIHVVVDAGLPWQWEPPMHVLTHLARRTPRH